MYIVNLVHILHLTHVVYLAQAYLGYVLLVVNIFTNIEKASYFWLYSDSQQRITTFCGCEGGNQSEGNVWGSSVSGKALLVGTCAPLQCLVGPHATPCILRTHPLSLANYKAAHSHVCTTPATLQRSNTITSNSPRTMLSRLNTTNWKKTESEF